MFAQKWEREVKKRSRKEVVLFPNSLPKLQRHKKHYHKTRTLVVIQWNLINNQWGPRRNIWNHLISIHTVKMFNHLYKFTLKTFSLLFTLWIELDNLYSTYTRELSLATHKYWFSSHPNCEAQTVLCCECVQYKGLQ